MFEVVDGTTATPPDTFQLDMMNNSITFNGDVTLKEIRDKLAETYSGVQAWDTAGDEEEVTRNMLVVTRDTYSST